MNNLTSLQRKLVYLGGIILLLIPIILLGAPPEPASVNASGASASEASSGGYLAQKRVEYSLGESDLGNVDPASSTMNLLLLGFRGIATSMLWMDAQQQQRDKDWAGLRATTESIILLQPHFLKVWHFQGWNLAYNVSAEWDGVADRYYWVKEGIKFFQKGRDRNLKYAELYWYVGDTTGKKIGRADESKQYRRYFMHDPDEARFKGGPDPAVNPHVVDNYVEASEQFQRANDTIEKYHNEQHIMTPFLFRSYPVRAKFDYATALQHDGHFDEKCRNVWAEAFIDWTTKYGVMEFSVDGISDTMKIHLEVSADELKKMIAEEDAQHLDDRDRVSNWVGRYQDTSNYRYWRTRSRVESEKEMSDAHREMYEGEQALDRADTTAARKLYLDGMTKYEKMINEYPDLKDEDETVEEGMLAIFGWERAIELDDDDVPDEFPLKGMWEAHAARRATVKQEFDRRRRASR
ncbi:MAG TPA: hypothetical protein VGH74_08225 [Planctomycetaceae bacterium]